MQAGIHILSLINTPGGILRPSAQVVYMGSGSDGGIGIEECAAHNSYIDFTLPHAESECRVRYDIALAEARWHANGITTHSMTLYRTSLIKDSIARTDRSTNMARPAQGVYTFVATDS